MGSYLLHKYLTFKDKIDLSPKDQVIVMENNNKEEFFKLICTKIDEYYTQKL